MNKGNITKIKKELNKWIVGSYQNEKTGYQKCKKCDADVVNLKETQNAYETVRIYNEHEKKYHGTK